MNDSTKNDLRPFFKRIQEVREDHDMTQAELSDKLLISRDAYGRYERGERLPQVDFLYSFCKWFNVSADYLLGLSNCEAPSKIVSVSPTSSPRSQFDDLTDDQRIMIESALAGFRAANAAAASREEA